MIKIFKNFIIFFLIIFKLRRHSSGFASVVPIQLSEDKASTSEKFYAEFIKQRQQKLHQYLNDCVNNRKIIFKQDLSSAAWIKFIAVSFYFYFIF